MALAEARKKAGLTVSEAAKKLKVTISAVCQWESGNTFPEAKRLAEIAKKAEADKLRRENRILKQNEASAKQAPVKGVRGGGATDTKPEDDFLRGFNSDY